MDQSANLIWNLGVIILALMAAYVFYLVINTRKMAIKAEQMHDLRLRKFESDILLAKKQKAVQDQKSLHWSGVRKFEVVRKEYESPDQQICSFYLSPHDGKKIPQFKPGQFLTFELNIPGQAKKVLRCYSLSDAPNDNKTYRVSIKRVPPPPNSTDIPPGLSSNYFHDAINVGDILDVKAPSGGFFLDVHSDRPVVLIGGGVGLTPVMSMLNTLANQNSKREVWFFYGIRQSHEHCFKEHLRRIDEQFDNIHIVVCYSEPFDTDVEGEDYAYEGWIGVDLFKKMLPSSNYQFLMCGPPPMMEALIGQLEEWGVPEKDILREAFGPASGKKKPKPSEDNPSTQAAVQGHAITFKQAGKSAAWNDNYDSLLDLAEDADIDIQPGCRVGNCGSCMTAIVEGDVTYDEPPAFEFEKGTCLPCCCRPTSPVTLDA